MGINIGTSTFSKGFVGNKEIQSIYVGNNKVYEATPPVVPASCTVTGLGSSSPSSVSFTKSANFTKVGLGITEETMSGDTFIKIPTMYRKVNTVSSNQITSFTISTSQEDVDFLPYSCFLDENGNLLPYVLIGKYWNTSSSGCVSTTEGSPTNVTTAVGRGNATSKGTGYQIFDWQLQKLWQDLIICLKETVNINSGSDITYDEIGIYWGASYGWIDGVMGSNGNWKFCTAPTKYTSLSGTSDPIPADYVTAEYSRPGSSGKEISKLGYNSSYPFFIFTTATVDNSSFNTYYCDGYWYSPGNHPVGSLVGGAYVDAGAFNCNTGSSWSDKYGVRLCYRPIAS